MENLFEVFRRMVELQPGCTVTEYLYMIGASTPTNPLRDKTLRKRAMRLVMAALDGQLSDIAEFVAWDSASRSNPPAWGRRQIEANCIKLTSFSAPAELTAEQRHEDLKALRLGINEVAEISKRPWASLIPHLCAELVDNIGKPLGEETARKALDLLARLLDDLASQGELVTTLRDMKPIYESKAAALQEVHDLKLQMLPKPPHRGGNGLDHQPRQ